jgi:hypothetical protein
MDLPDPIGGHSTDCGMSCGKAFGDGLATLGADGVLACRLSAPAMLGRADGEIGLAADRFPCGLNLRLSVRRKTSRLIGPHLVQQAAIGLGLWPRSVEFLLQLFQPGGLGRRGSPGRLVETRGILAQTLDPWVLAKDTRLPLHRRAGALPRFRVVGCDVEALLCLAIEVAIGALASMLGLFVVALAPLLAPLLAEIADRALGTLCDPVAEIATSQRPNRPRYCSRERKTAHQNAITATRPRVGEECPIAEPMTLEPSRTIPSRPLNISLATIDPRSAVAHLVKAFRPA